MASPFSNARPDFAVSAEVRREFPLEYAEPEFELADIVRLYGDDYRAAHTPSFEQGRALHAIEVCRTTALGAHIDQCDECGHFEISYNSCRNRHCPKCRASQRAAWVDARELELLPIQYFHVVFTLPDLLHPLARYHSAEVYAALMRAAAETLQTFARKQWDADLGIVAVLHTWGQTMNLHPHVHCIVTGGGLKRDGSGFVPAPKNFLFPHRALRRVFRAVFLKHLKAFRAERRAPEGRPFNLDEASAREARRLDLGPDAYRAPDEPDLDDDAAWKSLMQQLHQQDWVVHIEAPFADPEPLIRYLGRYVNRIAIANHRIEAIDGGRVTFRYRDNRIKDPHAPEAEKRMTLSGADFIHRFLQHVLPPSFHRIRYYGLLGG
ncbi:MAG TPA: hypothetical protein DDY14_14415, partial [Chromatiaceae bacterium]|nr:hypothetical protein [Chromatiaceae bacterium]